MPKFDPRHVVSANVALRSRVTYLTGRVDVRSLKITLALMVAAIGAVYLSRRVSTAEQEQLPATSQPPANPAGTENTPMSSWPAGPLAGPMPVLISDQQPDADHCVDASPGEDVVLRPSGAAAVWIFGTADDEVRLFWKDRRGTVRFDIPPSHFAHTFTEGRVTVSLGTPSSTTTVSVRSTNEPIRVCGVLDTSSL